MSAGDECRFFIIFLKNICKRVDAIVFQQFCRMNIIGGFFSVSSVHVSPIVRFETVLVAFPVFFTKPGRRQPRTFDCFCPDLNSFRDFDYFRRDVFEPQTVSHDKNVYSLCGRRCFQRQNDRLFLDNCVPERVCFRQAYSVCSDFRVVGVDFKIFLSVSAR